MGSVQGLPGTAGAHSTDNHWTDIVHTMGWGIFLLLYLAVCVHRYHGECNTCVASLCCHSNIVTAVTLFSKICNIFM